MATVTRDQVDIRGLPAVVRFVPPVALQWVEVLLGNTFGATRVAIYSDAAGTYSHTGAAGGTVAETDDQGPLPAGAWVFFDIDPTQQVPRLFVQSSTAAAIHVHVTREQSGGCSKCAT